MKTNKIILIYALIFVGFLVAAAFYVQYAVYSVYGNVIKKVQIRGEVFRVEIVDTPEKAKLGLGGRRSMCEKCGMLFVFSESSRHSFWMGGMEFPLDIIWIKEGKVVAIEKSIPYGSREIFSPNVSSDLVLELNSGISDGLGIAVGDELFYVK